MEAADAEDRVGMNRSTRKFIGYIRLVVSLLLVVSVAGVLYYLEIERRAAYFEQLRFRQLKEFVQSFDNNLASLRSVTREHAQLMDQDLSELRWLQRQLSSLPKVSPYFLDKAKSRKLAEAQTSLLSFGDRQHKPNQSDQSDQSGQQDQSGTGCAKECDKDCSSPKSRSEAAPTSVLYENLLKRAEYTSPKSVKRGKGETCIDSITLVEENKAHIESLSNAMNTAGCLGRIPTQEVENEHSRIADKQIAELDGMTSLDRVCTARNIRDELLTALRIFREHASAPNGEYVRDPTLKERLSLFVQEQIEMFWSDELTNNDRKKRERDFRVAAASATGEEIEKSRKSLERLIRLVESRYLSESSPLAASVEKHRLELKYEKTPESDAIELCTKNKSGTLFLLPTAQSGPYPGSSYSLGACAQGSSVAYTAPLEHFLENDIGEFSVMMIADPAGNVLYSEQSKETSTGQTFLNVGELISDHGNTVTSDLDDTKNSSLHSLERSGVRTLNISGTDYRLYILPYRLRADGLLAYGSTPNTQGSETHTPRIDRFYLIGMIPLSQVNTEKLSLSAFSAVTLLVISITILLLFVFLKIRWVPLSAAFTAGDRRIAAIVIVTMVMLGSLVWISVLASNKISDDFKREANHATNTLITGFSQDLGTIFDSVDALQKDPLFLSVLLEKNFQLDYRYCSADNTGQISGVMTRPSAPRIDCTRDAAGSMFGQPKLAWYLGCADNESKGSCWNGSAPIDNIFVLNDKGRLTGSLVRGTRKLVAPVVDPNLSQRKYFQQALTGDFWRVSLTQTSGNRKPQTLVMPVYMERIFNIVNGSLTTQFAIPISTLCLSKNNSTPLAELCDELSRKNDKSIYRVLSFGATIRSLLSPLLPHRFNYAVIDNATGGVLYHSTPSRSLVENFIQEAENNAQLQSYLRKAQAGISVHDAEAFEFDGRYRGSRTRFYARQLHPDIPWTLLVFHEMEYAQAFTSLLFTLSILISLSMLALIAGIAFLIKLFYHDIFVWLWPDIDMERWYRNTALGVVVASAALFLILDHVINLCGIFFLLAMLFISSVWLLGKSFARFRSIPIIPAHLGSNNRVTYFYTFFVMSLLIFWVAIPSLSISKMVGDNLLKRMAMYDGLVIEERRKDSEEIIQAHLEMRFDDPDRPLYQPYRTNKYACTCKAHGDPENPILARQSVNSDCPRTTFSGGNNGSETANELLHETGPDTVFRHALSTVSIVWPPASLLINGHDDERLYKVGEKQAAKKCNTTEKQMIFVPWKAAYNYPRLLGLIEFNGQYVWPLLAYPILLTVIFFLVRFLAISLLGMAVPRSYRSKPEVTNVTLD